MADRPVLRLSGGELLIHADAAPLLADLIEVAVRAEPRLWNIDSDTGHRRVALVRELLYLRPTSAATSDPGTAEVAETAGMPSSTTSSTVSAQEAARMLQLTTRQVTNLCSAGALLGEQDAPGRPWRVRLVSIDTYAGRAA